MSWVRRDGKLVSVWGGGPDMSNSARSALPCPNVIRDGLAEPLQHMVNGRFYDSKRAMEKADREAGCVCIGNEVPKQQPADIPPWKDDVAQAYEMVKQGYKPQRVTENDVPEESGWF